MNSLNRDIWVEDVKNQVSSAWFRGANWACKGRGYALDTADTEAEAIIKLVRTLLEEARAEYEKTRAEEVMEASRLASDLMRNGVVKECKTKVVDYFAGSGELFFPYIEVGAETREEEIELAKNELEDLLESIFAITNPKEGK